MTPMRPRPYVLRCCGNCADWGRESGLCTSLYSQHNGQRMTKNETCPKHVFPNGR